MKIWWRALAALAISASVAGAEPLAGTKDIVLQTRDGQNITIGAVVFTPRDGKIHFDIQLDRAKFTEYFLSMVEFKCVEGPELNCHVPYPYANPRIVSAEDLSWLEHGLLFFTKSRADYGAQLAKGVIYTMKLSDGGIVGAPQSIDLNMIATPPDDRTKAAFTSADRYDFQPGERWVQSLTIAEHR